MPRRQSGSQSPQVRGQKREANSLLEVVSHTVKLWRKYHLTYDQTKHVIEQARRALSLEVPRERRRTVERLDRAEVERLIETAYGHSSRRGFLVKMLFYTGARVSELVRIRIEDLHLALEPPQIYIAQRQGWKRRLCPDSSGSGARDAHAPQWP
jgi:integrase/recombinase XerD